jgi:glycolate oxidase FAD binding subunit
MGAAPAVSATRAPSGPDTVHGVQDAVRQAAAMRTPLRIVGRGTWLDAGPPVSPNAAPLPLDGLDGITEYTPGDLTLTARAGTSMAAIDAATAAHGQWLPLDPYAAAEHGGSLGATIATASVGPLAAACGLARDLVLGLELVAGDGSVVRAGGRVVKNVAGFDITRLMTGAWGTLGVLTEITVRLRARPPVEETLALLGLGGRSAGPDSVEDAGRRLAVALRSAPISPLAAELIHPTLAERLMLPATKEAVLLVRLGGNGQRVAAERAALAEIGDTLPTATEIWTSLRRCESLFPGDAAVLRWSRLPSQFGHTWTRASRFCKAFPQALVHGSLGRGVVRAIIPQPDPALLARAVVADRSAGSNGDAPVAERLPTRLWSAMAMGAVSDRLSHDVRRAFDPAHVLNPGLMDQGWARD